MYNIAEATLLGNGIAVSILSFTNHTQLQQLIMPELLTEAATATVNLMPYDGLVQYFGTVFSPTDSKGYYHELLNKIAWKNDEVFIYGRRIITSRKTAWYGDEQFAYTYSKITRSAMPWTEVLAELRDKAEGITGERYNCCLLNLYHSGLEGMGWHSDDEKELLAGAAIASISFGADRKFVFKHKTTKQTVPVVLHDGSLLLMKDATQKHWLHRLPPTKTVQAPRINLTFRKMNVQAAVMV